MDCNTSIASQKNGNEHKREDISLVSIARISITLQGRQTVTAICR